MKIKVKLNLHIPVGQGPNYPGQETVHRPIKLTHLMVVTRSQICFYSCILLTQVHLGDIIIQKIIYDNTKQNIPGEEEIASQSHPYLPTSYLRVPYSLLDWPEKGNKVNRLDNTQWNEENKYAPYIKISISWMLAYNHSIVGLHKVKSLMNRSH